MPDLLLQAESGLSHPTYHKMKTWMVEVLRCLETYFQVVAMVILKMWLEVEKEIWSDRFPP